MQNGGVIGLLFEILNVGREIDLAEKLGENLEFFEIELIFVYLKGGYEQRREFSDLEIKVKDKIQKLLV